MTATDAPTVGVLSLHTSKETKAICNAAADLGADTEWLRAENTAIDIADGVVTLEPDVDVIVNRLLLSTDEYPAEGLGLARAVEGIVPTLNDPSAVLTRRCTSSRPRSRWPARACPCPTPCSRSRATD